MVLKSRVESLLMFVLRVCINQQEKSELNSKWSDAVMISFSQGREREGSQKMAVSVVANATGSDIVSTMKHHPEYIRHFGILGHVDQV